MLNQQNVQIIVRDQFSMAKSGQSRSRHCRERSWIWSGSPCEVLPLEVHSSGPNKSRIPLSCSLNLRTLPLNCTPHAWGRRIFFFRDPGCSILHTRLQQALAQALEAKKRVKHGGLWVQVLTVIRNRRITTEIPTVSVLSFLLPLHLVIS